MPKKYPAEVHGRAVRMTVDRLSEYPTVFASCKALAPKLNVGIETLRKWVVQAKIDAGVTVGRATAELDEIRGLKKEVRDLKELTRIAAR